jgi:cytochrome c oxidase subunit 2
MTRRFSFAFILTLALAALALFAAPDLLAEQRANNPYWIPELATEGGKKTDDLLHFIFWLTLAVFIATQVVFIWYLVRYRRRPGVRAEYTHGNNKLEVVWTLLPSLIFIGLAVVSNQSWTELTKTPPPSDAISVDIVGFQFAWDIRYGGADGTLDDADWKLITMDNKFGYTRSDFELTDDFTATELVVPVGKPVRVVLRSRDVIHSFYVPEFRLYQDAVPGRTIDWMWFVTTRTGNFELACNQLCGAGHYNMKAKIRVVSQAEYDEWHATKVKSRAEQVAAIRREKTSAIASVAGTGN